MMTRAVRGALKERLRWYFAVGQADDGAWAANPSEAREVRFAILNRVEDLLRDLEAAEARVAVLEGALQDAAGFLSSYVTPLGPAATVNRDAAQRAIEQARAALADARPSTDEPEEQGR